MNRVLHLGFKGLLDLLSGGNLTAFGSSDKRLQKGPFLLKRHIFMTAPTGAGRFNGRQPKAIVGRNDPAYRRNGDPGVLGNLFGFAHAMRNEMVVASFSEKIRES